MTSVSETGTAQISSFCPGRAHRWVLHHAGRSAGGQADIWRFREETINPCTLKYVNRLSEGPCAVPLGR